MIPLPNEGLLTKLLQIFVFNFAGATGRLTPDAQWLLIILFGIELIIAGIWFAFRRELDVGHLVAKAMTAAVFFWLITNWVQITKVLMQGFLGAGIKAGGDASFTELDFTNPDRILLHGFGVTGVIFRMISETSLWSLKAQVMNILAGLVTIGTMVTYICLALLVFVALLEFYGSLAMTLILLPFGMLTQTRWLAEKAIAHTFAGCIRIGSTAFLISLSLPLMVTTTFAAAEPLAVAFYALTVALALAKVAYKINKWVQSMLHGTIAFGAQDIARDMRNMSTQITYLGNVMQTVADLLARSDPTHPSRQTPTAAGRRP